MLGNVIFVYFINTGCLVYPAKFTCFDNLSWSFNLSELDRMSLHYENWSKAGKTPNFSVENPFEHVKYFNWVPNWIEMYFFTKVSDFIFGLLFVMLLLSFLYFCLASGIDLAFFDEMFLPALLDSKSWLDYILFAIWASNLVFLLLRAKTENFFLFLMS